MRIASGLAAMVVLAGCASMDKPKDGFQLVYLGRDAIFIENATIVREGSNVSFRTVRAQDSAFKAGETVFLGGLARMQLDCSAKTFQLLSFQSVKPGMIMGPESATRGRAAPIAGGSAEMGMARTVCDGKPPYRDVAKTMEAAFELGRKKLDGMTGG